MNLKELFEILPQLLNLYVPGFVFLFIYNFFVNTSSKEQDTNVTTIGSIVLSYIFNLISTLICSFFDFSEIVCTLFSILLAIACVLVFVKIRLTSPYKKITTWIGKITGNKNIWCDFFDLNNGTRIRFFTTYNNKDVIVEGNVKYYEATGDGECNFVLTKYQITYNDDSKRKYTDNDPKSFMFFNTKNIHGLEAHQGQ